MSANRVIIKGTSEGLVVNIGAGSWPRLMEELEQHLSQKASFFKGGRVALHVGSRQLSTKRLEAVGKLLARHNVSLWAVESDAPATQTAAAELGLEVTLSARQLTDNATSRLPHSDSIVVQRTVRSGQVITHPGNVVIIGDVNPGAEIRAGGSVVVWGRLRGLVHAGAGEAGDEAVVCALHLAPTQLRINNYITRPPADDKNRTVILPEIASIQNGRIIAEGWSN